MALIAVILVNIWLGIPFNLTLLYSGLQDIPEELYEAGALDGATGWKAFWHITWPNLRAVVSVVLMLGVIYTLKVLDIILGLTQGGPANATQTIATQSYQRSFVEFKFGQGAALSQHLDPDLTGLRDRLPARHPAPGGRVRRRRCQSQHGSPHARPGADSVPPSPSSCWPSCCSRSTGCSTSRSRRPGARCRRPSFLSHPSLDGYRTAIHDQGQNLVTSLLDRRRHRGADPADRHTLRRTPWPSSGSAGSTGPCWRS